MKNEENERDEKDTIEQQTLKKILKELVKIREYVAYVAIFVAIYFGFGALGNLLGD